jgi:hypothetical protein
MLVRFKRGAALVQPHQLVRQRDAEHFDIGALGLARMLQGLRSTSAKPSSESDDGPRTVAWLTLMLLRCHAGLKDVASLYKAQHQE